MTATALAGADPADLRGPVLDALAQASDVAALRAPARGVDEGVERLYDAGTPVEHIAAFACELNAALMRRLWALVAPGELAAASCLVVMGSEGRGEQILKTDQDNALLLRDGPGVDALERICAAFSAGLAEAGFPPCPGRIMVTNPLWRQPLSGFKASLRDWMLGPDPHGPMNLAIFLDGAALAGDASLLAEARRFALDTLALNDAFLARFAAAADQFTASPGWWARLTGARRADTASIDLKKVGIFPIVHGVRALALQHRIAPLSTVKRIAELAQRGVLDPQLARELTQALHFLMALRLGHQLGQRRRGAEVDNLVVVSELDALPPGDWPDCQATVKRFRQFVHRHFRLDTL
jgi:CBS domain-containing protein